MRSLLPTVCVVLVSSVVLAGEARAGRKTSSPVVVGTSYAYGALGSARNSADSVQFIGCSTWATATSQSGLCQARDSASHNLSCTTSEPNLLAEIRSMAGDSFVYFTVNASGECTLIQVNHSSELEPK